MKKENYINLSPLPFSNVIIRIGEIHLKSPYVRKQMIRQLLTNIHSSLGEFSFRDYSLQFIYPRIYLFSSELSPEKIIPALKRVFGISSFSFTFSFGSYERLKEFIVNYLSLHSRKNFAVITNRLNKDFSKTSLEINQEIGTIIKEKYKLKINLDNPEVKIYIDYHQKRFYLYFEKIQAFGGLPVGVSGKAVVLLSSGFDSPIAAWLMMRRGVKVYPLHLKIDKQETQLCRRIWEKLSFYMPGLSISLEEREHFRFLQEVRNNLIKKKKTKFLCLLCKRKMLREAEKYAQAIRGEAIITGDSLGQVASQTLSNLKTESAAIKLLILRPLIGWDKEEIIKLSRKIGLYELSAQGSKIKCPFLPRGAIKTSSQEDVVEQIEKELIT